MPWRSNRKRLVVCTFNFSLLPQDILVPVEANGVGSRSSTMLYSITESTEVQPRRRRWITAAPSLTNADEPVLSHPIKHRFRFLSAWAKVLPSYPACKIPGGTWQRKWKQIICPRLQTEFCICSFGHDERHHLYALHWSIQNSIQHDERQPRKGLQDFSHHLLPEAFAFMPPAPLNDQGLAHEKV